MVELRMTLTTQRVLEALLEDPGRERYGREIGEAAGLRSGTV
ncbi:PadR family transcriptional regulator, partial [Modestobacter sp. CPCC 205119]|nr:PadR family transcriptional regulator [Goekera deserti]